MAAMLTGGQRLGLLSTTLSNSSLTSTSASFSDISNATYDGGISGTAGISSNSKSVVLVKLTDSAFNAIADYIKKRNQQERTIQRTTATSIDSPTINFSQQSGTISIPSLPKPGACLEENRNGGKSPPVHTFNFSISDTVSDLGPQGSFECLQSSKKCRSVDTLGSVQKKLQVHASANSYQRFGEKLRTAQNESKKHQTRILERDVSQGLITSGKVVRKPYHPVVAPQNKPPSNSIHPPSFSNSRYPDKSNESDHPPPFRPFGTGGVSPVGASQLSANHPMLDRSSKGPYYSQNKQGNTEIIKRALRERIVHLLAVRPHKKPELVDRIHKDGVKEKDKRNIMGILRTVSDINGNSYALKRCFWNDVSEDWPFYTDEERQLFKRRKPQNLTPPGSDGGISISSIGSGHSSSSSHPASPQPTVTNSANIVLPSTVTESRGMEQRQDGYRSGINSVSALKRCSPSSNFASSGSTIASGIGTDRGAHVNVNSHPQQLAGGIPPPKKKRVSNYRRPPDMKFTLSPHNNSASYSDSGGRSPAFSGLTGASTGRSPRNNSARGTSNGLNLPTRASPSSVVQCGVGLNRNDYITPSSESKASEWLLSNGNNLGSNGRLGGQESPQKSPTSPPINVADPLQHWNTMSPSPRRNDVNILPDQNNLSFTNNCSQNRTLNSTGMIPGIAHDIGYMQEQCTMEMQAASIENDCQTDQNIMNNCPVYDADMDTNNEFVNSSNHNNAKQIVEHQDGLNEEDQSFQDTHGIRDQRRDYSPLPSSPNQFVGTDFRIEYTQIRNRETRKRYKEEFSRNYDRYRELHCKIEKVSKRFSELELQLRREIEGSASFKRTAEKVQKEYQQTKGRPQFLAMREEFEYLHEKMAHIKKLVQDFDRTKH